MNIDHNTVFLLDIDGTINEAQQPVSDPMLMRLWTLARRNQLYFVTGNTYLKSVDILGSPLAQYRGVFCNNGDELRSMRGKLIWQDTETKPLPDSIEKTIRMIYDCSARNAIEWRSPRFLNFSKLGRYATQSERLSHDASWRADAAGFLKYRYPEIETSIGGAISVDVYSHGADKSRAAKWIVNTGKAFVFIGDKTHEGGNDYPIKKFCDERPENICLQVNGTKDTMKILDEFIG